MVKKKVRKNRKEKLLGGLDLVRSVGAEIGPLNRPLVSKRSGHVIYVDHCDTEHLRKKYANDSSVNTDDICVDTVWGAQTLQQSVEDYFARAGTTPQALDYVVASHVIEHVPDLITWLQEIRSILKSDGEVRLAVPDRRYTFDLLRRTTSMADVLAAYVNKARMPSAHCLLDSCLNVVAVDCAAAWRGSLDVSSLTRFHTVEGALGVARDAVENGNYHDVHCWVFTPSSFAALFAEMSRQGLLDFACADFYNTPRNEFEFIVNMRVCDDASERTQSWECMYAQAEQKGRLPLQWLRIPSLRKFWPTPVS